MRDFLFSTEPLFDVRSPGEFQHSHIPGAVSLPLFSDEERAQVGLCYKQQGKEPALMLGLKFVGPKLSEMADKVIKQCLQGRARVYCWRGGMRSSSVAMLLRMTGLQVMTLEGGYKRFRRHVLQTLSQIFSEKLVVIGGMTGSGKTEILRVLKERGEQVVDLEQLANHRGSAFGGIGMELQPSVEQFENKIACLWDKLDLDRRIWLEDESRMIGKCKIPDALFAAMMQAKRY